MTPALPQDVRHGVRSMLRAPGFTTVAVATLALGIGSSSAVFSLIDAVLLHPLPLEDPERIVVVSDNLLAAGLSDLSVSVPEFLDYRSRARSFEELAALNHATFNLTGGGEPERISGAAVSAAYFDVLRARPLLGRGFAEGEDEPGRDGVALVSEGLWRRRWGGDPALVGSAVRLDGKPHTVVGVVRAGSEFPPGSEIWVPLAITPEMASETERGSRFLDVLGRLRPGVGLEQAREEMSGIAARLQEEHPGDYVEGSGWAVTVTPLTEQVTRRARPALLALGASVSLLVLIACVNVANLLIARSAARRREMAVRAALGAGRARLVRQLLVESLLLALPAGLLGLALGAWLADLVVAFAPRGAPGLAQVGLDARAAGFALAVSVAAALAFGLVPALQASAARPHDALRDRTPGGGRPRRSLRDVLVAAEVALSLILLVAAALLARSLGELLKVDAGFEPGSVLTMGLALPESSYADEGRVASFYDEVVRSVEALPGVRAAGAVSLLPLSSFDVSGSYTVEERPSPPGQQPPESDRRLATPGYFAAMGIPILRGRPFTDRDGPAAPGVVIVDEVLARTYWPGADPLGKRLKLGWPESRAPWLTIVGVARHVRHQGLDAEGREQIYVPLAQSPAWGRAMSLVVRAEGGPGALAPAVISRIRSLDPDLPVSSVRTMSEVVSASLAGRRIPAVMVGVFAAAALLLTAVGLYGVVAHLAARRTQEIGIQLALGAGRRQVLSLVVGQGLRLALLGAAAGLAGAIGAARLLEGLLFGVGPADPLVLAGAPLLLLSVALLAAFLPARRASRIDPIAALRTE